MGTKYEECMIYRKITSESVFFLYKILETKSNRKAKPSYNVCIQDLQQQLVVHNFKVCFARFNLRTYKKSHLTLIPKKIFLQDQL